MNGPLSANVVCDDAANLLIVDGVRISRELLNHFVQSTPEGMWFRVVRAGDVSTVHVWYPGQAGGQPVH